MRFLPTCALLLSLSAVPAFSQSGPSAATETATTLPANASDPSVDYSALRERLADQNKSLSQEVATQRAVVRKNQVLLKQAQKLDASNRRLEAEKKKLELENTTLEKERQALKSTQKTVESASVAN